MADACLTADRTQAGCSSALASPPGHWPSVDRERTLAILRRPIAHALQSRETPSSELAQLALADFLKASHFSFFLFKGKTYFDVAFKTEVVGNEYLAVDAREIQRVFLSYRRGTRMICAARCAMQSNSAHH
jgi:hypothetical protein